MSRTMNFWLLLFIGLATLVQTGCDPQSGNYFVNQGTIESFSPASQDGIIGGVEVVITGDFPGCSEQASVVFGNRNGEVLEAGETSIRVLTPSGPAAAGEVAVRVACGSSVATADPEDSTEDSRVEGFVYDALFDAIGGNPFANELGSFKLAIVGAMLVREAVLGG